MSSQAELRRTITEKIVASLKLGRPPWKRPWSPGGPAGLPANVVTGRAYSGVNTLILSAVSGERDYPSRWWGTYRQWAGLGAQVRRRPTDTAPGDWGCRVVYCRDLARTGGDADAADRAAVRVLKSYCVFNAAQVDGLPAGLLAQQPLAGLAAPDYAPAEEAIRATGADIRYGGDKACYSRPGDSISIPPRDTFLGVHEWYATHFHELSHWAERRVGWEGSYALGELVAEISACYLCDELGVPQSDDTSNHEAYVAFWVRELEGDHHAVFKAAGQASRTSDYLLGFSRPAACPSVETAAFA